MQVFVAGATGAVGRRLVPALVMAGHAVTAMGRSREKLDALAQMWAIRPLVVDALNREEVIDAVTASRPDVVIFQLTAVPASLDFRKFEQGFGPTNRLRTVGLDHLIDATVAAGAARFIAQSFTGPTNARVGSRLKTESDPMDPSPPAQLRTTLDAISYLERRVASDSRFHGMALRYGGLYGPNTSLTPGGDLWEQIEEGRVPIVGGGTGIWSFVHIDDAVSATIAALGRGTAGVYNIVDDEPAPVYEWLPYLAAQLGARRPRQAPAWLAKWFIGDAGVSFMTEIRGSSNAKAKRELGWEPEYPSWRNGFRVLAREP